MKHYAYYNEFDPYAAQWLRNLIFMGHIAPGFVDERSIADVKAEDLKGFTQCHFFAGIGIWSAALRNAGWPDNRPVWTGSAPCQPFSAAGKGEGFDDPRHLWPYWKSLIAECRPVSVFGEQAPTKAARAWLDLVFNEVENMGYTTGAVDFSAAGSGAANIRQRHYFRLDRLADLSRVRQSELEQLSGIEPETGVVWSSNDTRNSATQLQRLGHTIGAGLERHGRYGDENGVWSIRVRPDAATSSDVWLADSNGGQPGRYITEDGQTLQPIGKQRQQQGNGESDRLQPEPDNTRGAYYATSYDRSSPIHQWSNPDWLLGRDGKWRPVESGTFPLAHGHTNRVGKLRAYGNAINFEAATDFIVSSEMAIADVTRLKLALVARS